MNHLIWRLHRNQVYFAAGVLVALAVLLVITGTTMADDYRSFLANCGATQSCGIGRGQLFSGDGAIIDIVNFTMVVPLLFGLFWGAPLLAKEFEDGTHGLAWTQGVTRRHWLRSNVMWAFLAALVWGAAMAALVSWWRFPENALDSRFGAFDIQGIAPVAYSLFAVALGIGAGAVLKRVLPALASTLGIFVAVRVAVAVYVRPHYMTPVRKLYPLIDSQGGPPSGSWVISSTVVGPGGQTFSGGFGFNDVPAACRNSFPGGKGISGPCLSSRGFHQLVIFQPGSRFWAFQGVEAAFFVVLALALVGFATWWVLTRDA